MSHRTIDARIRRAARARHGVLTRRELLALGATTNDINRLARSGWLTRVAHGVYTVGSGSVSEIGVTRAAVLGAGRQARAGGWSVLFLNDAAAAPRLVDVVTTNAMQPRAGVRIRRTSTLPGSDTSFSKGVPSTTVARALVDISPEVDPLRLVKYMRKAAYRERLDIEALRETARRLARRGTSDNIRRAILWYDMGDGGGDSELEARYAALLDRGCVRRPRSNVHLQPLRSFERVDFVWLDARLVIEVDGPHHLDPLVRADDRRRDRALTAAGFQVLRFWWWEIEEDPDDVLERTRVALAALDRPTLS